MKKLTLFLIGALFLLVGCTTKKKESIEGVWQMVSAKWIDDSGFLSKDTAVFLFPGDVQGGQIKAWLDGYVVMAGTSKVLDYDESPSYVAATYTLDGDRYSETIIYHDWTASPGTVVNMILELKNDTLIQKFPVDENWNLNEKGYMYEKYVRMK